MKIRRRIANRWSPVFLVWPRRVVRVTQVGDEVEISWVWGRAFRRYSVFQGRFMGIIYSKTDQ